MFPFIDFKPSASDILSSSKMEHELLKVQSFFEDMPKPDPTIVYVEMRSGLIKPLAN